MRYCTVDRPANRSTFPLALTAVVVAVVAGLSWIGGASAASASPAWVPNDDATPPRIEVVNGVRRVVSPEAPARLLPIQRRQANGFASCGWLGLGQPVMEQRVSGRQRRNRAGG